MRSFRVGGTSLPTFESSVNKSVQVFCLSRPDRVPPRSVSVLYSIVAGSLVSLFRPLSAFKGGRKSGGDRRRTAASVPVMQKVGPVRASLRCLVSWPVQLPWNRGSRPRCEIAAVLQPAALVSCEFQPVFSSIRAIHVPPPSSFFFYACADFFSRLSFLESDIKEATWSRTKETISVLLLTFARTFFFFFSFVARFIEQSIMWTSIFQGVMLLCLFFQFLRVPFIDAFLWYLLSLCIIEIRSNSSFQNKCVV